MSRLYKSITIFFIAMIVSLSSMVPVFGPVYAPLYAKEATPMAEDPVLEEQVKAVSDELRCLVCQNQTIADSSAPLAVDLKTQVREMLSAGKTEIEVVDYMVERYGDFVRYRPPVKPTTMLLWFGPMLFLVIGGSLLFMSLKRRSERVVSASTLSEDESKQVNKLLSTEEKVAEKKDKS